MKTKHLLVTMLLLLTATLSAYAQSGTSGDFSWEITNDTLLTISGTGEMPDYTWNTFPWYDYRADIKKVIIENGIASISKSAFSNFTSLSSVTIPNTVTIIGEYAFADCDKLTSVIIPNSVQSIGKSAFSGCKGLNSAVIGNSVTSIEYNTFLNCTGLVSVTIGNSVTFIGRDAFSNCNSLSSVTIPNSVTHIGSSAFLRCYELTSVTIPNSVTFIGNSAFSQCISLTSVTIPNSITVIGNSTFSSCCRMTSVTIPNSVTTIEAYAFASCESLTTVTIPNSVTSIGASAFDNCSSLTSVTIPNSVTSIGAYAFDDCRELKSIIALNPEPVTITSDVFSNVNKATCTLTVPTSSVGKYKAAEDWKDFTNIIGGGLSVRAIPDNALLGSVTGMESRFYAANETVNLTAKPAALGIDFINWTNATGDIISTNAEYSFTITSDTLLTANFVGKTANINLTVAGSLNKNISNAGSVSKLTLSGTIDARDIQFMRDSMPVLMEIDLSGATIVSYTGTEGTIFGYHQTYPANEMPQRAFCKYENSTSVGKTSIVSLLLPHSVVAIGYSAFSYCNNLNSIVIPNMVTTIGNSAFCGCSNLSSVTVGNSVTTIEEQAFYNCSSLSSVTIPNSVTAIGREAFSYCSSLSSVTIGNSVATIGSEAFSNCSSLSSVTIPNSVTAIGSMSFYNCSSLSSITIGNSVTVIENATFRACTGLTSITIPNSIKTIGAEAFYGCTGLSSVTIGNSVTSIETSAFNACTGLSSLIIGNSVMSIGNKAFYNCSSLSSVSIPNSVTTIRAEAFSNCSSLSSVTIGNSVTSIGGWAFYDCSSLSSVVIPNSVTSISNSAFSGCTDLSSVTIGYCVATIGTWAFARCSGLSSITALNPEPISVSSYDFEGVNKTTCTLTVSTSSVEKYKEADVWKEFKNNIIGGGLSVKAVSGNTLLGSVSGVEHRFYASGQTVNLTAIPAVEGIDFISWTNTAGDVVSTSAEYSFTATCDTLLTANFEGKTVSVNMTTAGELNNKIVNTAVVSKLIVSGLIDARDIQFMRDSLPILQQIDLSKATIAAYTGTEGTFWGYDETYPANEIPRNAFQNCHNLTSIIIPNSITTIGYLAFSDCRSLSSITIPNSVTSIGNWAFAYCSSLSSIVIPSLITIINEGTFCDCSNLTSVVIGNSVTSIGRAAFSNCSALNSITALSPELTTATFYVFNGISKASITLTVPTSIVEEYKEDSVWKYFTGNIIGGGLSVKVLPNNILQGSISGVENRFYTSSETVELTATPNSGYVFTNWTNAAGNVLSTANPYSFIVNSDTIITANFEAVENSLSYINKNNVLQVYPNPVSTSDILHIINSTQGNTISIYTLYGTCVAEYTAQENGTAFTITLPQGVYIVKSGGIETKLIVK